MSKAMRKYAFGAAALYANVLLFFSMRVPAHLFTGTAGKRFLVFFSLIPIGIPILFIGLHLGVAFIQAYVFVLLTTVYLAGAVAEGH